MNNLRRTYWASICAAPCIALAITPLLASAEQDIATRASQAPHATTASVLEQINEGLADVFERVAPAVVVVKITRREKAGPASEMIRRFGFDFFLREPDQENTPGEPREEESKDSLRMPPMPQSEGSGFIFSPDGYILTNYHVVADAVAITVRLKDGREFEAKVVGRDDKTDVAVLKIDADRLTVAKLADSEQVRVGNLACVIGAPYNLDYSFTVGVVSAVGRNNLFQAAYESYIQTDASINPGNSGGPLLDIYGRVIGINTLINGVNRGLGFAIPINMARDVATQLIEHGRVIRPWLGIRIQTLSEKPELRETLEGISEGVVVETIEPDTPAYRSSLLPADVITAIDGEPVETALDLQRKVLEKKVGQTITLKVWRAGKFIEVSVITEELPGEDDEQAATAPDAGKPDQENGSASDQSRPFGLGLKDITPELAKRLDITQTQGVLVMEVEADSPADVAGILPRDVITEVGKRKTPNLSAFREALKTSDPTHGILVFIDRGGEKTYAMLKEE